MESWFLPRPAKGKFGVSAPDNLVDMTKAPTHPFSNPPDSQKVAPLNEAMLGEKGVSLTSDSYILDFGCGIGRHVYEYLDRGHENVFGDDVRDRAKLREPDDRDRFRVARDQDAPTIPFPDNFFDFVFSTSVMEHVQDQEQAFREINRVLKQGGVTLHIFPSRWRPLEPHMYVPFGSVLKSRSWMHCWAALGIRRRGDKGLSAKETAEFNYEYARTRINYLSGGEIDRLLSSVFGRYSYEEVAFVKWSKGRASKLHRPMTLIPGLAWLFRQFHTRVIYCTKPV